MKELQKLLKQFTLGKSLITSTHEINERLIEEMKMDNYVGEIVIPCMVRTFADKLVKERKHEIKLHRIEDTPNLRFELQLMVFPISEFKMIVDAAINLLTDEQIQKIKDETSS